MLQLLLANPSTTILATAPSNSAADLLARKLIESNQLRSGQLLRLNALSRSKKDIPDPVLESSYWCDGQFKFPSVDVLSISEVEYNRRVRGQNPVRPLKDYRVVVATCVTASVPYQLGLPRGHFDWIFVDEAGQACEPEAMIAVKTMAGPDTNLVLSGDVSKYSGSRVNTTNMLVLAQAIRTSDTFSNRVADGIGRELSGAANEYGDV